MSGGGTFREGWEAACAFVRSRGGRANADLAYEIRLAMLAQEGAPRPPSSWCSCGHEHATSARTCKPDSACCWVWCECSGFVDVGAPTAEEREELTRRLHAAQDAYQASRRAG